MSQNAWKESAVERASRTATLPNGYRVRPWAERDFISIQKMSAQAGWKTANRQPEDAKRSWEVSWPALVMYKEQEMVGFLRAISDGFVTTYVAELLIDPNERGKGLGTALLEICRVLHPSARIDLLSTEGSDFFYQKLGFKTFPGFRRSLI